MTDRLPDEIHNPQHTQLSIARHYGGINFNGIYYLVVPVGANGDWKLVREDVIKARAKAARVAKKKDAQKLL